MSAVTVSSRSSPLRAPVDSGARLAVPPLTEVGELLQGNRRRQPADDAVAIQGRSLRQLREWARQAALPLAVAYTQQLTGRTDLAPATDGPWLVSGHQPGLIHPGVWAKHLALGGLAGRLEGVGLNLIVDQDLCQQTVLRVPRGPRETPWLDSVPFLEPQPARPWEAIAVDRSPLFAEFGARVGRMIESDWGFSPMLQSCWPDALEATQRLGRLADGLTAMRRRQESRYGVENLELPVSELEETPPFRWFASHLLAHAGRFRAVHNSALAEYRRRNRIRSSAHPVPDLRERAGWIESPFWIWRDGEPLRSGLFVQPRGRELALGRLTEEIGRLRLHPDGDACCAVEDLAALAADGWRIRTRALTTTLFARLCLSDLFIHGIGGAKYDEVTDRIMTEFWGVTPPGFLVLTATLHLPLGSFAVTPEDERAARQRLRSLQFHADWLLPPTETADLVREREALVVSGREARSRRFAAGAEWAESAEDRRRHQRLREISRRLAELAAAEIARTRRELADVQGQLAANRILRSREYAWCLFPEAMLREFADRLSAAVQQTS